MRMRRTHTALLLGATLIGGCGGGGGGVPVAPAARLLPPAAGQSWTYSATGTLQGTGFSIPLTGQFTKRYAATTDGSPGLLLLESVSLSYTNGQTIQDALITQVQTDPTTGDVQDIALQENGAPSPDALASPIIDLPGNFTSTFKIDQTTTQNGSGNPYSHRFQVMGTDRITVATGTYDTWRVQETTVDDTSTTQETSWYAPELGREVKANLIITDSDNPDSKTTLTLMLTSTNVSPPSSQ